MDFNKSVIHKFTSHNFNLWKLKMEYFIIERELKDVMNDNNPDTMKQEDWDKMNAKAIALIGLNLFNSMLMNVTMASTTKGLWDRLRKLNASKSLVNLTFTGKKLYALKMKDGDRVTDHLNVFNSFVNQLKAFGNLVKDVQQCIFLLCILPDSWNNVIVAISGSIEVENL